MKVMVFVKATADSEAGKMPSHELIAAMGAYNQSLIKAGIMKDGGGLKPTRFAKRVRFSGKERIVTDGPFTETKELVCSEDGAGSVSNPARLVPSRSLHPSVRRDPSPSPAGRPN